MGSVDHLRIGWIDFQCPHISSKVTDAIPAFSTVYTSQEHPSESIKCFRAGPRSSDSSNPYVFCSLAHSPRRLLSERTHCHYYRKQCRCSEMYYIHGNKTKDYLGNRERTARVLSILFM